MLILYKDYSNIKKIIVKIYLIILKVLACMTGCFGQDDEAACQFICQWELGQANEKYLNLLKCMAEHGCLSMQPDGICLGDSRCDFVLLQFHGNLPPPPF